jgi:hypothetical protein
MLKEWTALDQRKISSELGRKKFVKERRIYRVGVLFK